MNGEGEFRVTMAVASILSTVDVYLCPDVYNLSLPYIHVG